MPRPGVPGAGVLRPPGTPPSFERGTVLEVDARRHLYRVRLNNGAVMTMGRLRSSEGDTVLLSVRTPVVVSFALGAPYIFGVLPSETAYVESTTTVSGEDGHGGQDPALDRHLSGNGREPLDPVDLLPGDQVMRGPDGATVSSLRGHVAQVRGGPLAMLQAFGASDTVQITAGQLRTRTWQGYSETVNERGKTTYRWRGGSDQLSQTGADEERYTIALDVGHDGDLFRFEVTNREGQAVFRVHVDPEGHAEVFAAGGVRQHNGRGSNTRHDATHHGDAEHRVTGASVVRIGGDQTTDIGGSRRTEITGSDTGVVGGSFSLAAADSIVLSSAGDANLGSLQTFRVQGDRVVLRALTGTVQVDMERPDSIQLGRSTPYHASRYEPLSEVLTQMQQNINELRQLIAGHTHPSDNTPSAGLVSLSTTVTYNINGIKSLILQVP